MFTVDRGFHDEMPGTHTKQVIKTPRQGYILAVRTWDLRASGSGPGDGYRLVARFSDTHWPPGQPLEARCGARPSEFWARRGLDQGSRPWKEHPSPPSLEADVPCLCGIYGVSSPDLLRASHVPRGVVWGYVALWGRVRTAWKGRFRQWRAQYAYPQAIVNVDPEALDSYVCVFGVGGWTIPGSLILEELAETYGIPLLEDWVWETGVRI